MPSWDIALCYWVNAERLHGAYLVKRPLSSCIAVTNLGTSSTCTLFSIWQAACCCRPPRVDNSYTAIRALLIIHNWRVLYETSIFYTVPGKGGC
jgi:hypothetical protein